MASRPLRAWRDDLELGPGLRQRRASASRSSGSSSAISAVGRVRIMPAPAARREVQLGARRRAARRAVTSQLRVAAEGELQALAQRREAGAEPVARRLAGPTPVSLTRTRQRSSRSRTSTSMRPPSSLGSMPWRTAFSTSVSSVIGGQRSASAARIDVQRELQAIGHAHLHQLEIGAHQFQLLPERRRRLVQARHRRAQVGDQAASTREACGEPASTSACTLASVLNRKCGCTCACSSCRRASERLALELAALELEGQRLVARQRVALAHHRPERDPGRESCPRDGQAQIPVEARRVLAELRVAAE